MYVSTTIPESALLAHDDFVRRLARRVARDEHQVDDIVQETWLAALRQGHRVRGPLRPWLARVIGNVAADQHRSQSRRERREAWVARDEAEVSTAVETEATSARSKLVRIVLDMPEPYRSTIVLRYYEELGVAEIAQQVDVPIETVRTRLKRGLRLLRRRVELDREGPGSLWGLGVLFARARGAGGELVQRTRENLRAARAAPSATQIVVAAFVPAVALAVIALIATSAFDESSVGAVATSVHAADSARGRESFELGDRTPVGAEVPASPAETPAAAESRSVSGRVLDESGVAQPGVRVAWWPARPAGAEPASGETVSDAFGRYRLDGVGAAFSIDASGAGLVAGATLETRQVAAGELSGLDLDLVRPLRLEGHLRDHASAPVAGAQIQLALNRTDLPQRTAALRGLFYVSKSGASAQTDASGAFAIANLPAGKYTLSATHPDFPRLSKRVVAGTLDLELTMPKPASGVLEVVDASGAPLAGARVTLCGAPHELTLAETRADGRARLSRFECGASFFVRVEHALHAPTLAGPFVVDDAKAVIRVVAADARTVVGSLRDGGGAPIANAAITVRSQISERQLDSMGFRALREVGAFGSATTAADGSFELRNLPRHGLVIDVARDGAMSIEQSFELAPDVERVDLAIGRGAPEVATLEITVRDAATGLAVEDFALAACPHRASLFVGPRRARFDGARGGRATWATLRAGDWWLCVKAPGFAAALVPIEHLEPGAREVAVELFAPRVLALEIVDRAGAPVANAALELSDGQGRPLLAACQPRQNASVVRTGSHGEATLFDLPASTVRVAVTVPDRCLRFDPFEFDLRVERSGVQRLVLEAYDRDAPMRELSLELPNAWIGEPVHVAVFDERAGVRITLDGVLGASGLQPTHDEHMAVYQQVDEIGLAKTMWLQGTIAPRAGRANAAGDGIELPVVVWNSAQRLEVRHGAGPAQTVELSGDVHAIAISPDGR